MANVPDELITVGELKEKLDKIDNDVKISFGEDLSVFLKLKKRGKNLVQLEFRPLYED